MTYFNADELPEPSEEYVAWVDVMGIQSHMQRSINSAANFVFKLHVAALDSPRRNVTIYPIMDGFYATSTSRDDLQQFLLSVFRSLALLLASQTYAHFRFVMRGAVAFGLIYHGRDIGDDASKRLAENLDYRSAIFLGMPVVYAHVSERHAPPFGIYIHQTARETSEGKWTVDENGFWHWVGDKFDLEKFGNRLESYYDWCADKGWGIAYDPERVKEHRSQARAYFRYRENTRS